MSAQAGISGIIFRLEHREVSAGVFGNLAIGIIQIVAPGSVAVSAVDGAPGEGVADFRLRAGAQIAPGPIHAQAQVHEKAGDICRRPVAARCPGQ